MVNSVTTLQLFQILKQRIGEEEAEALVDFVDTKKENNESNLKVLATKDDIARLEIKIAESKSDLIKWMVSFFFALVLTIIGLYFRK